MPSTLYPPTERIVLKGHKPLSSSTVHGWPAMVLGLIVFLISLPIIGIGMEWIDYPKSSIHAPMWVIRMSGGLFATGGIWAFLHGAKGLHRQWNVSHGQQHLPDKPWQWDYPWQAGGIIDNKFNKSFNSVIALAVFSAFLAPFNWIAFVSGFGGLFWQILTGFFDVVVALGAGSYLLKNVGQLWAFGTGKISFSDFPFFLGQTMRLTIERLPSDLTTVHLTIRCIKEAYEIRKRENGQKRESVVICYQIYHDTQTIRGEQINETGELRCSWDLPDDTDLASTPSNRPARFWELEVKGTRSGINYHSHFLLPIYVKT